MGYTLCFGLDVIGQFMFLQVQKLRYSSTYILLANCFVEYGNSMPQSRNLCLTPAADTNTARDFFICKQRIPTSYERNAGIICLVP